MFLTDSFTAVYSVTARYFETHTTIPRHFDDPLRMREKLYCSVALR
jgi:hypothetical protein